MALNISSQPPVATAQRYTPVPDKGAVPMYRGENPNRAWGMRPPKDPNYLLPGGCNRPSCCGSSSQQWMMQQMMNMFQMLQSMISRFMGSFGNYGPGRPMPELRPMPLPYPPYERVETPKTLVTRPSKELEAL